MRSALLTAAISGFFIFVPLYASAATYYVDGASLGGVCSDVGAGTALSTPWCTIQKAASTANAGDTINIRAGTYRETVTPTNSGTNGNTITYQAYSGETPVVNGADVITGWTPLSSDESTSTGLFFDGNEANDNSFTNYSSTGIDSGNTLTVQSGLALHGTYALAATFGGTNRNARLNKAITASPDVYTRMYFRINSGYSITANDVGQMILQSRVDSTTARAQLLLLKNSAGLFYLQGKAINPANNTATTIFTGTPGSIATDTPYYVEMRYKGGDASTGGAEFWVNGVSQGSSYTWNTSTTTIARLEIGGSTGGTGVATAGSTLYIDDVQAATSPIGAFSGGSPNIYKATASYRINQLFSDGTKLATSTAVTTILPGYWYDDFPGSTVYVRTADNSSPNSHTIEGSRRDNAFILNSKNYLTFDGITVRNINYSTGTTASGKAYAIATSSNLTIKNSTISYNFGSGIYFINSSTSTISNNTFVDNERQFGGAIRLEAGSNNNTISGNTITGIGGNGGNGIVLCGDDTCQNIGNHYNTITGNTFYNLYDSCVYITSRSNYNVYEKNICGLTFRHLNSQGGAAGGTGVHVSRGSNYNIIRNNIFYDNEGSSIGIQSDTIGNTEITTTGTQVYNNTVYNGSTNTTAQGGISFQGTTTESIVRNNIVYQSNAYSLRIVDNSTSTVDSDYNIYYSTQGTHLANFGSVNYDTLSALQAASGLEAHSLSVNPLLTSASTHDFSLTASSPAINAGATVGLVSTDYIGAARPSGSNYDIGAYEFASAVVSSGGGSSGGGGGGVIGGPFGIGFINTLQNFFFPPAATSSLTTASSTAATSTAGFSEAQIQSILSLLASLGVGESERVSIEVSLRTGTPPAPATSSPAVDTSMLTRDLELGDTGDDVKLLQQYLNAHGYVLANSGPGSVGNETMRFGYATQYQLKMFQKDNGITPAAGYFGPKTRALLVK